jgi:hypothetical protein
MADGTRWRHFCLEKPGKEGRIYSMELHVTGDVLYLSVQLPYLIILVIILVVISLLRKR